jgi:hypothetical protein
VSKKFNTKNHGYLSTLKLLEKPKCEFENENNKRRRNLGMIPSLEHLAGGKGGKEGVFELRNDD